MVETQTVTSDIQNGLCFSKGSGVQGGCWEIPGLKWNPNKPPFVEETLFWGPLFWVPREFVVEYLSTKIRFCCFPMVETRRFRADCIAQRRLCTTQVLRWELRQRDGAFRKAFGRRCLFKTPRSNRSPHFLGLPKTHTLLATRMVFPISLKSINSAVSQPLSLRLPRTSQHLNCHCGILPPPPQYIYIYIHTYIYMYI